MTTSAKPTPGPWRVLSEHWVEANVKVGWVEVIAAPTYFMQNFPEQSKANARLIAAAPDLADALRRFTELSVYDESGLSALQAEAYALLTKLEG